MKGRNLFYLLLGILIVGFGTLSVFAIQNQERTQNTYPKYPVLTGIVKGRLMSSINFDYRKSTNHNNQFTAEMWDTVLDALAQMQIDIGILKKEDNADTDKSLSGDQIPAGAVMAFALGKCPKGWENWEKAEGRFLLGTVDLNLGFQGTPFSTFIGEQGGTGIIKLTEAQLPPHFHYMFGANMYYYPGRRGSPVRKELPPLYKTPNGYAVDGGYDKPTIYNYMIHATEEVPTMGKTSTVGAGKAINIMNPYVYVLYCIKK